jgi:rhodanese-related sulfurtransferase
MKALAMIVFVLATPLAWSADDLSPQAVPGATTIDVNKAKTLFDQGVLFVDVRSDKDWEAGRIPGAEHLELKKVYSETTLQELADKASQVVFYCNGEKCLRSSRASEQAVGWGYSQVFYFRDGFPAWSAAGFPVE